MANINVGNLPVAISVTGDDYVPLDQGGVTKRAKASLIAGTATGFVPTTRRIDAGVGLSGGGTLATDVTINFDPSVLFAATTQAAADQYVIQQAATSLPKTITFANSMKAIGTLGASPALDLVADKFVVLRAADGLTYSATASQISLAAGNVPAGGTVGQVLAKNSSTNYDTSWINNSITLNALSIAANPTAGTATSTSVTLGSTLTFVSTSLRTVAGTGDVTWSANSFATTISANAVTNAKFRQSVAVSVVGNATNATADVADITGTANQILRINGAGTALAFGSIDLAQTAAVGTSILPVANGGTGVATTTAYALLAGGTTSTGPLQSLASVGTSGQVLVSNGAGNLPTWQTATSAIGAALTKADDTNVTLTLGGAPTTALLSATSITAGWTGQLSLTRGGTAASLTASNGGIVYSNASAMAILAGTATAGQHLQSGSSAAPSWTTATFPSTAAAGTILAAGTANTITATATPTLGIAGTTLGTLAFAGNTSGTVTVRPQAAAGTPTLTYPNASGTFAVSATAPITLNTTTGDIGITSAALTKVDDTNVTLTLGGTPGSALLAATSITAGWTGQLSLARGGSNASLTASNGGIVYSTASAMAVLSGTATANQILMSGSSAAPAWSTATYPATTVANQILYSSATNTVTGLTSIAGGVLNTNSSTVPLITASPTLGVQQSSRGQLILANTAAGAYSATVQSSNSATAATTITLPPDAGTNGYVLATDGAGTTNWIAVAGVGTVTSIGPGSGLTSTLTATAPGSAITGAGTLSAASLVNAQTGTTYTMVDGDRAKTVTFSNTSSVAVTLPQAGAASAFQAGWFCNVQNLNRGAVTITPTTSTINNGAATLVLQRGQGGRIVSDGTNYTYLPAGRPSVIIQKFTSSGTYTPTTGMTYCIVEMVGGGGGGGGSTGNASYLTAGGGGGAGGYSRSIVSAASIGASQVVTIGAAGTASSNSAGGAGGNTSLGSLVVANGGSGGSLGTSGAFGGPGAGGTAGTGDLTVPGAGGQYGPYVSGTGSGAIAPPGASGGMSFYGGGSAQVSASSGTAVSGNASGNYGNGGGGGISNFVGTNSSGGAGSAGLILITEFFG